MLDPYPNITYLTHSLSFAGAYLSQRGLNYAEDQVDNTTQNTKQIKTKDKTNDKTKDKNERQKRKTK